MATVGSAKSTLVNKIDTLTASATAKDSIYLGKALKEVSNLNNFVWKGAWAASTEYALDDVVSESGNSYICIAAHTSAGTFAVGSNWSAMAIKGTDGVNQTDASNITSGTLPNARISELPVANISGLGTAATKTVGTGAGNVPVLDASGQIADAQIAGLTASKLSGALPAIDGSSLTDLNATNIGSGTVPTARLGTGTADSTVHLRGDGTWAAAGGGKVLQVVYDSHSGIAHTSSTSFADTGHHTKAITSTALNSSFLVTLAYNPQIGNGNADDGQLVLRSSVDSYSSNLSWGRNFDRGTYHEFNTYVQCLHSPSQAAGTTITYKSYFNSPSGSTFKLSDYWANAGLGAAPSTIIIMEIGA